jgi:threonine dehydratase
MPQPPKHHHELRKIKREIAALEKRVNSLKAQGATVDQVNAALADLKTKVEALIASKGQAGITPAQAQTIVDGINSIAAEVVAATTSA